MAPRKLPDRPNGLKGKERHTFTKDERDAPENLGDFFATDWPEIYKGKVVSFPTLSQTEKGLPTPGQEALVNQEDWLRGSDLN